MKACPETTSMFCSREKLIGLKVIQQNEKSTRYFLDHVKYKRQCIRFVNVNIYIQLLCCINVSVYIERSFDPLFGD